MLFDDSAINSSEDDVLDRMPFARMVAAICQAASEKQSTVVAITGGWGSGKSSVANLAAREIGDKMVIARFSPWMVESQPALFREFFATIATAAFPDRDSQKDKSRRASLWKYGARCAEVLSLVPYSLMLPSPAGAMVGAGFQQASKAMDSTAKGLDGLSQELTLWEQANSIKEDFSGLEKNLLIVIDDLDRLTHEELRTVLQLIKACADFPRVCYLLLFDENQVLDALKNDYVDAAPAFLEKIVQYSIPLPDVDSNLWRLRVKEDVKRVPHLELSLEQQRRLDKFSETVLLNGITTYRQFKRYLSMCSALLRQICPETWEVDPVDFMTLEYLRHKEPDLYSLLREYCRSIPEHYYDKVVHYNDLKKNFDERVSEKLKDASDSAREAIWLLEAGENDHKRANSEKRYGSLLWRSIYFSYQPHCALLPGKVFHQLIGDLDKDDNLFQVQMLKAIAVDIQNALALASYVPGLAKASRIKLMEACLMWPQKVPAGPTGRTPIDGPMNIASLVVEACLASEDDPMQLIKDYLVNEQYAATACMVVARECERPESELIWSNTKALKDLRLLALNTMNGMLAVPSSLSHPRVDEMMIAFQILARDDFADYINHFSKNEDWLVSYVENFYIHYDRDRYKNNTLRANILALSPHLLSEAARRWQGGLIEMVKKDAEQRNKQ